MELQLEPLEEVVVVCHLVLAVVNVLPLRLENTCTYSNGVIVIIDYNIVANFGS